MMTAVKRREERSEESVCEDEGNEERESQRSRKQSKRSHTLLGKWPLDDELKHQCRQQSGSMALCAERQTQEIGQWTHGGSFEANRRTDDVEQFRQCPVTHSLTQAFTCTPHSNLLHQTTAAVRH